MTFTCSCRSVNDCKFRWFKAFKRESSNLLLNRKWPEVLKSRNLNPVSPEPPGPRAQAPRRPWGREWRHFAEKLVVVSPNVGCFLRICALKNTIKTRRMAANMHETTELHWLPTIQQVANTKTTFIVLPQRQTEINTFLYTTLLWKIELNRKKKRLKYYLSNKHKLWRRKIQINSQSFEKHYNPVPRSPWTLSVGSDLGRDEPEPN